MPAKLYLVFSFLAFSSMSFAGEGLLYMEVQSIGGYSSMDKIVYHSMSADEPMQKSSVGFDLLQKFSGTSGDLGTLFLQGRLAWDKKAFNRLELQVYNAYYRFKTPYAYVWAGHNRTAAGLESYFDTHGALLQPLPMYGYGFDRDWGMGISRDFNWGDAAFSLTTGSGMRLTTDGNYLVSGRVSIGVLSRDNYTAGLYASAGKIPEIVGYRIMDSNQKPYSAVGADYALLWDRWELRADLRGGTVRGKDYMAGLGRIGINLLDENRLKLEVQSVYSGMKMMEGWTLSAGAFYAITASLSGRVMFEYEDRMDDKRVVMQLYYYLPIYRRAL